MFIVYCDNDNIPYHKYSDMLANLISKHVKKVLSWKIFSGIREAAKLDEEIRLRHKFILCPKSTSNDKNSSDITLAIEVMKDLFRNPAIQRFIICSNDSDFIPLCREIQEHGKECWLVIDSQNNKNEIIHKIYDKVLDLNDERQIVVKAAAAAEKERMAQAAALTAEKERLAMITAAERAAAAVAEKSQLKGIIKRLLQEYEITDIFCKHKNRINISNLQVVFAAEKINWKEHTTKFKDFLTQNLPISYSIDGSWIVRKIEVA